MQLLGNMTIPTTPNAFSLAVEPLERKGGHTSVWGMEVGRTAGMQHKKKGATSSNT